MRRHTGKGQENEGGKKSDVHTGKGQENEGGKKSDVHTGKVKRRW
ncbi:hypothetical protein [Neisseria meningitidis]|nr:hypothetical protein [Neisseria meningitidis]